MTVESVLAHGLKTSVFGSQWNAEYGDNLALLDPDRIKSDLLANRPAAGVAHRFFFATDNQKLYYDTGAAWVEQSAAAPVHAATHAGGGTDPVTLAQSQVTNLAADLAAKAAATHTHAEGDITNLAADLAAKAAATHAHAIADVAGLQSSLDGKIAATGNQTVGGVKTFADMTKFSRGAQVASAAALNLSNEDGIYFNITGTTGITSISTRGATGTGAAKGVLPLVILKFDGALTITHNAASLILPGGANIATYAGLDLIFVEESAGNWRCIGGNTLFGDYGSQDFTYANFTPAGTAALENITGAGKEFPFTPKFTGAYELEWVGAVFPGATTTDEVNVAVDASAGSPTVIRKAVAYVYASAGDIRRDYAAKTIFILVAGTAYTFNVQVRNITAARAVAVGYNSGSSAAKWFIKRIA